MNHNRERIWVALRRRESKDIYLGNPSWKMGVTEVTQPVRLYLDELYTLWSLPQFLISVILACPESFLWSQTVGRIPDKREWHWKQIFNFWRPAVSAAGFFTKWFPWFWRLYCASMVTMCFLLKRPICLVKVMKNNLTLRYQTDRAISYKNLYSAAKCLRAYQ